MRPSPPFAISIGRAFGITGLFLAFQIGCSIPVAVVLVILHEGDMAAIQANLPTLLLVANSAAAYMTLALELRRQKLPWLFTPPARASFAWMLVPTIIATLGTAVLGGTILETLSLLLPSIFDPNDNLAELFDLVAHPVTIPLTLVVVAPLTEEFIFRGLILGGLLRRTSPTKAILLSATLFSGMHLNLIQLPTTFMIGLVYGWIYYRTRSLGLCIFAHMLNNALAMLVTAYVLNLDETLPAEDEPPLWVLFLTAVITLSFGLALIRHFTTRPPVETPPPLPPSPPPPLPPAPTETVTQ